MLNQEFLQVCADIASSAAERERTRTFDKGLIQQLKEVGFTRLRVPTEFGGLGLSLSDTADYLIQLASADSNIAQALRPHFLAVEQLLRSPQQGYRERWLRRIGSGTVAVGNALTEKGGPSTTLTHSGDHFELNGHKYYSTGALYADVIQVRANTGGSHDAFALVAADSPGITLIDDWDGFGQKLTGSGSTVFEGVRVEAEDVEFRDYTAPAINQSLAQIHHLSTLAGIAVAVERDIAEYVRGRKRMFSHSNTPLAKDDPQVQQVIGEVSAAAQAVHDILAGVVRRVDKDAPRTQLSERELAERELDVFRAQIVIAPLVLNAATKAFEVGGASATSTDLALDRHWRNARVLASHNPLVFRTRDVGADVLHKNHAAIQYTVSN